MDPSNPIRVAGSNSEGQCISGSRSASHDVMQIAILINALRTPACYFGQDGEVLGINDAWLDYARSKLPWRAG